MLDRGAPTSEHTVRFPITFSRAYGLLSTLLFLSPAAAYVEITGREVQVRMGWAFRTTFVREVVVSAAKIEDTPLSRGAHGFGGRWLVNGSGEGILNLELQPPQRAYVMGFPIRLRQLLVSVADPFALASALGVSI